MLGEGVCPACSAGQHAECYTPEYQSKTAISNSGFEFEVWRIECCCHKESEAARIEPSKPVSLRDAILGGYKADEDVKNSQWTGRKRAAALYPIEEGSICEWANLAYAGGGVEPVVGCRGNKITAKRRDEVPEGYSSGSIHHGPDKDTMNNNPENVHRVCQTCHNRWHSLNDPYYGERMEGQSFLPLTGECRQHDTATLITENERAYDDAYWALPSKKKKFLSYRMITGDDDGPEE